jgi:hypothetical protein
MKIPACVQGCYMDTVWQGHMGRHNILTVDVNRVSKMGSQPVAIGYQL